MCPTLSWTAILLHRASPQHTWVTGCPQLLIPPPLQLRPPSLGYQPQHLQFNTEPVSRQYWVCPEAYEALLHPAAFRGPLDEEEMVLCKGIEYRSAKPKTCQMEGSTIFSKLMPSYMIQCCRKNFTRMWACTAATRQASEWDRLYVALADPMGRFSQTQRQLTKACGRKAGTPCHQAYSRDKSHSLGRGRLAPRLLCCPQLPQAFTHG